MKEMADMAEAVLATWDLPQMFTPTECAHCSVYRDTGKHAENCIVLKAERAVRIWKSTQEGKAYVDGNSTQGS